MLKYFNLTVVGSLFLVLGACSSDGEEPVVPAPEPCAADVVVSEFQPDGVRRSPRPIAVANAEAKAVSQFAGANMSMLKAAAKYSIEISDGRDNTAFSPLSASIVMAMMSNAVNNGEENFFPEFLGDMDLATVNNVIAELIPQLQQGDGFTQLSLNNSLWVNYPLTGLLTESALDTYTRQFLASVYYRDYTENTKSVLAELNQWCSDKTNGAIKDHYKDLDGATICNILNAMTFKAPWRSDFFDADKTSKVMFNGTSAAREVEMMVSCDQGFISHYTSDAYEMAELPFGNGTYVLQMIKQRGDVDVNALTDALDLNVINGIKENPIGLKVEVTMPQFKVATGFEMTEFLEANTQRFASLPLYSLTMFEHNPEFVVLVRQSNTLSIDSEGATGAVITNADMMCTSTLDPVEPQVVKVVFDRPFVFAISEYSTGLPVFGGIVTNL